MASVKQIGAKWRAQVAIKGVRRSAVWDTETEARKWAKSTEDEIRAGLKVGRSFKDAADHYTQTVSTDKDSPDWEKRRLNAMVEHFGASTEIASIDSAIIGAWRDKRLQTVSGSTVQREANLLRHLFTLASDEWRWVDRNPFKGVRLPKENPPRHQVWTWQLIRRLLRAERTGATAEMIRAFHISLHTGLRLAEVLGAEFDARRRVLRLGKTKGTRKGVIVEVPVTKRAARALPDLLAKPFTTSANMGSTLFSRLCRENLIEGLTFHDARATALTLLSRRMDVMTLARISRHKDLKILLNVYYRESVDDIAKRI